VSFQKKLRSHRLKRGIASFSVILGREITIRTNHKMIAAIHSEVHQNPMLVGGGGSGFASWFVCGGGSGSGFDGITAPRFGGTGGFRS
jgi:hypothetical protein